MLSIAQTCYTAGRAYDEWRVSIACFASLAVPAAATSSLRSCGSSCRSRTHCATSARWHWCGGWTRLLPAKLSPSCACSAFAGPRCGSERAGLTRGRMLSHSAASRCSCSRIRSWRGSLFQRLRALRGCTIWLCSCNTVLTLLKLWNTDDHGHSITTCAYVSQTWMSHSVAGNDIR